MLANIYLHYVLDRWVRQWRRQHAHGEVIIVRFADDFVAGFEHKSDAEQFLIDLRERFLKFALELHPDKTRLIEFGRDAARDRAARGDGKPETFDFLGFTHYCAKIFDQMTQDVYESPFYPSKWMRTQLDHVQFPAELFASQASVTPGVRASGARRPTSRGSPDRRYSV